MYSYCYYKKEAKQKSTIMGAHCVAVYTEDLTEGANAVVDPYSKEEREKNVWQEPIKIDVGREEK